MELPRSRALVRLDGPGHIMPVEPVTPPNSTFWRAIHTPAVLGVVAVILLALAVLGFRLLGAGFRLVEHVPGLRYLVPVLGAVAVAGVYWVFVRAVERRQRVDELSRGGSGQEIGWGAAIGLALSLATLALLALLGHVAVTGINPARGMIRLPLLQLCTAVVLEIIANGIAFRLIERSLGTWLALLLTAAAFGAIPFFGSNVTPGAVLAVSIEVGLLCAAAYVATRRLWAPIGLYAAWNFAQVALYGVAFGPDGPKGLLLTEVAGPAWLTGGAVGTDASAPALLLSALAVAALLGFAVRRGRIVRPTWQRNRDRGR